MEVETIEAVNTALRNELQREDGYFASFAKYRSHLERAKEGRRELSPAEATLLREGSNNGTLHISTAEFGLVPSSTILECLRRIRNCTFEGECTLLLNSRPVSSSWIIDSTILEDCVIVAGANIVRNTRVRKCLIWNDARIEGCGLVTGPQRHVVFSSDVCIEAGMEGRGRSVAVTCVSSLEQVARLALHAKLVNEQVAMGEYMGLISEARRRCELSHSTFDSGSVVSNTFHVENVVVFPNATITSGASVLDSVLLNHSRVDGAATVQTSILQEGAQVGLHAIVVSSVLCQASTVNSHAKVSSSLIGPKCSVANGEVTASVLGPMVGFHHQSMLIACFWPRGRGNVAYGANIGSNHTSRAPDQSIWPGEGCFFGLSAVAKLPLNMARAPYSIIASGVVFGPGVLNLPFSLVTQGGANAVRVAPGWCLSSNAYFVERCCHKMAARAPPGYATEIFRAEIAREVWRAYESLRGVLHEQPDATEFRSSETIGILEGSMTRKDVGKGLMAYKQFLLMYALRCLPKLRGFKEFQTWVDCADYADTGLSTTDFHPALAQVIISRCVTDRTTDGDMRRTLQELESDWCNRVRDSKSRDYTRADQIFPHRWYSDAVGDLDEDAIIKRCRTRLTDT